MRMVFVIAALAAACVLPVSHSFAQDNDKPPSLEEYNDVPNSLAMPPALTTVEEGKSASGITEGGKNSYENLLKMYKQGQHTSVAKELEPLAKGGHPEAIELMGIMYRQGQGVTKDVQRAFDLLQSAAESARPLAAYHLATMYHAGEGVQSDLTTALKWLHISIVHYPDGPEKQQAIQSRDALYKQMTRREKERALQMAREWLAKRGEAHLLDME